jgi:hypothetical protein
MIILLILLTLVAWPLMSYCTPFLLAIFFDMYEDCAAFKAMVGLRFVCASCLRNGMISFSLLMDFDFEMVLLQRGV